MKTYIFANYKNEYKIEYKTKTLYWIRQWVHNGYRRCSCCCCPWGCCCHQIFDSLKLFHFATNCNNNLFVQTGKNILHNRSMSVNNTVRRNISVLTACCLSWVSATLTSAVRTALKLVVRTDNVSEVQ